MFPHFKGVFQPQLQREHGRTFFKLKLYSLTPLKTRCIKAESSLFGIQYSFNALSMLAVLGVDRSWVKPNEMVDV